MGKFLICSKGRRKTRVGMKRRHALLLFLLALAAVLAGWLAWHGLTPPKPLAVRLAMDNPYDGELRLHAVEINGRPLHLPGLEDGASLPIAPHRAWRARFPVDIGGQWPVRVRMTLPQGIEPIEVEGTIDARFEERPWSAGCPSPSATRRSRRVLLRPGLR